MLTVDDDLSGPEVADLVGYHMREMREHSPEPSRHTLDLDSLRTPEIAWWTVWDGQSLMGCAALREVDSGHGEIKSQRTAPEHLRKGVAKSLLSHIIGVARDRGYIRLGLETGSGPAFDPALALYRSFGFKDGEMFGDYRPDPFLRFMHLDLL